MQTITRPEDTESVWKQIAPLLQDALERLSKSDREIVQLHFFGNRSYRDTAQAMGVSEFTARKRVSRAIERLWVVFEKRGVVLTLAAFVAAFSTHVDQAVPVGLTASVATAVFNRGMPGTTSAMMEAKGIIKLMAWAKIKVVVGIGTALLLAVGGGITLAQMQQRSRVRGIGDGMTAAEIVKKIEAKYASLTSYCDTGISVDSGYDTSLLGVTKWTLSTRLARTNYYLVEARTTNLTMVAWSAGQGDFEMSQRSESNKETCMYWKADDRIQALGRLMVGKTLPILFFEGGASKLLHGKSISRAKDEKIGAFDCCVLINVLDELEGHPGQFVAWIGKDDLLIHQLRYVTQAPEGTVKYTTTHENISLNEPVKKQDFKFELPTIAVLSEADRKIPPHSVR